MQHYSDGYIPEQVTSQPRLDYAEHTTHAPDYIVSPINLLHDGRQQQSYQERPTSTAEQPRPTGPQMPPNWQPQPQQYYAPQYAPFLQTNEAGMDGKFLAAFCYLGFWVTGLIVLLFVRENRFVRFHAIQSLTFYGAVNLLYVAFISFMGFMHPWHFAPFLFVIAILGFILMNIIAAVAWFVGIVGALSGKQAKFPFVGDFAERTAQSNHPVQPILH